jgi:hypothetical protein
MPDDQCFNEVKKFMACEDGRQFLEGIRDHLKGHTIEDVEFIDNGEGLTTILRLSNGQCYAFNDEELWLETLREQFSGLFCELTHQNTLERKGEEHDE